MADAEVAVVLKLVADQFQAELKKSGGALGQFNTLIKDWKTQLTAVGVALFAIAKSTANAGEELLKTSQKIGISVETLSALNHAANMADLNMDLLTRGLKTLSANMVEASRHTGNGEQLFRMLGVSAVDAGGKVRPTADVLLDLAGVFNALQDGASKTDAAVQLFGKSGLDLIPFLNQGKEGITALMTEAERLGLVMSTQDAEAANALNDNLKRLQGQLRGVTLAIGKELIPTITELVLLLSNFGIGGAVSAGIQFLHERFIGLNVLLKELQANAQFLFGTGKDSMSLEQLRARIAQIEADGKKKVDALRDGPAPVNRDVPAPKELKLGSGAEEERKGKQILEYALAKLATDKIALDQLRQLTKEKEQLENSEIALRLDAQSQLNKEQEILGNAERDYAVASRAIYEREKAQARDLASAKVTAAELSISSYEEIQTRRLELLQLEYDQEIETATRLGQSLAAIRLRFDAQINRQQKLATGDFIDIYQMGLQDYISSTNNVFNLATDMARQTAQAMHMGFKTFFFDLFTGQVTSLKSVLKGLLNFAMNVITDVMARLATIGLLKFITSMGVSAAVGGADAGAGSPLTPTVSPMPVSVAQGGLVTPRGFARGGPVTSNGDSVPALLQPGEYVISKHGVDTLNRMNQGLVDTSNKHERVDVHLHNAPANTTADVEAVRQGERFVINVVLKNMRQNGALRNVMQGAA